MTGRIRKKAETEEEEGMAEMGCRIVYSCSRLTAELRLSSNWQGCFADFEVVCLIMASTNESNYVLWYQWYQFAAPKVRPIRVCMNNGVCLMKGCRVAVFPQLSTRDDSRVAVA